MKKIGLEMKKTVFVTNGCSNHSKYRKYLWDKLREMQSKTDGYYQNGKSIYEFENKSWIRQHPQLKENRMKAREKYNKRKQKR